MVGSEVVESRFGKLNLPEEEPDVAILSKKHYLFRDHLSLIIQIRHDSDVLDYPANSRQVPFCDGYVTVFVDQNLLNPPEEDEISPCSSCGRPVCINWTACKLVVRKILEKIGAA